MATLVEIYEWFMTGKKPTQAQFWASWGSFWNKSEQIPQSSISGLPGVLNAKAEKAQFDAHKTDENAHAALFAAKADAQALLNHIQATFEAIGIELQSRVYGDESLQFQIDDTNDFVSQARSDIEAINTLLTSDDINLDTVQEIVDAIKTVETSLSTILVNDLTTGGTTKALTAEMGKTLKGLIDGLVVPTATATVRGIVKTDTTVADPVVYTVETADNLLKAKVNAILEIKPITGIAYTLLAYDTANLVQLAYDGTLPMTVTIPNDATLNLPVGSIFYTVGSNTGALTIAGGAGVTFQTAVGLTAGQNETRKYVKKAANKWGVEGGVAATAATPLEFKKCYLKGTGNDSTAVIGSGSNPFLTLEGLMNKMTTIYGNLNDCEIIILDSSTYTANTVRTVSDFVIKTNFQPTVRISQYFTVTNKFHLSGKMTFDIHPMVGVTNIGNYFFVAPSGANSSNYINIKAITRSTDSISPAVMFQSAGSANWETFRVVTMSGIGRFSFESGTSTKELFIDTLTDGYIDIYSGESPLTTLNIKTINYSSAGTYDPFPTGSGSFNLKLGAIVCSNASARVSLAYNRINIELMGGVYQNVIFQGTNSMSEPFGCVTGKGIIEYKSAIDYYGIFKSPWAGSRTKHSYSNLLRNLNLVIRDTNAGAYLNAGAIVGFMTNYTTEFAGKIVFDNVKIEIIQSTCPLIFTGGGMVENANYWNVLFKNGCHFVLSGYLVRWRNDVSDITDATSRTIIAKLGSGSLSYDALGITNTLANLTIVDISN